MLVAVLVGGLVAGGLTYLSLRDASGPAAVAGGALPTRSPAAYRIVYRVEDPAASPVAVTTDVVEVVRPHRSRLAHYAGPPPGGARRGGSLTLERGTFLLDDQGRARLVQAVAPGESGADLRLATTLAFAERRQQVRRDGTGEVAGRSCTWWLSREPLDVANPAAATDTARVRSCVDDAGLLLADTWSLDDHVVRTRTAVEVAEAADLGEQSFTPPPPGEPPAVAAVVRLVAAPVEPGVGLRLRPPTGLSLVSAATVLLGDARTGQTFTRRAVYGGAQDLLVVDQVRAQAEPPAIGVGEPVALGPVGPGVVRATPGGLVIEAMTPGHELLRIRTSLHEDVVLTWLRSLTVSS